MIEEMVWQIFFLHSKMSSRILIEKSSMKENDAKLVLTAITKTQKHLFKIIKVQIKIKKLIESTPFLIT